MNTMTTSLRGEQVGHSGGADSMFIQGETLELAEELQFTDEPQRFGILRYLPALLRWLGVVALAGGAAIFMMQGFQTINLVARHYVFLGIAIAFGITGFYLAIRLRETRGARTFLGLTIAAMPVLFSQLGGMLLNQVAPMDVEMPRVFMAASASAWPVALHIAITSVLMAPLVYYGFRILAGQRAYLFTSLFFLTNAALLIPIRETSIIGPLLLILIVVLQTIDTIYCKNEVRLHNLEGLAVRLMMVAPLMVMFTRSLYYGVDNVFVGALVSGVGYILLAGVRGYLSGSGVKTIVESAGLLTIVMGWLLCAIPSAETFVSSPAGKIAFLGLPAAALIAALASMPGIGATRGWSWSAFIAAVTLTMVYCADGHPALTVLGVTVGSGYAIMAFLKGEKFPFFAGVFMVAGGLAAGCWHAVADNTTFAWVFLIALGALTVVSGSLVERYRPMIGKWHGTLNNRFTP